NLVFWGRLAAHLDKKCKKGTRLLIQGSLLYRDYIDVNNIKREITDIRVQQFVVLDANPTNTSMEATSMVTDDEDTRQYLQPNKRDSCAKHACLQINPILLL